MVVDEGGAVTEGVMKELSVPVAIVGTAEKGYQSIELIAQGTGGHSSMPPNETAVGVLAAAVARIEQHPMPARFTPLVAGMFDRVGRSMTGLPHVVFANMWLTKPVVMRQLASSAQTNAMIRTTAAPTMLEGSPKDNVLPQRARAVVNFRLLPGDSIKDVVAHVTRVVDDARVTVRRVGPGSEPSPVSPQDGPEFALIERALHAVVPNAIVTPYLLVGGTESRHYGSISPNVFRGSGMFSRGTDLDRAHGTNERAGVNDLRTNVQFYVALVRGAQPRGE
jgi:carboxypeptidase PM20D1